MEPPRRDGENAQKTRKNGEKTGEIQPNKCEGRDPTKDRLAGEDEAELARRIVEAFAEAEAEGNASITVDGQFVDYPIAEKARRTLETFERNTAKL